MCSMMLAWDRSSDMWNNTSDRELLWADQQPRGSVVAEQVAIF